MVAGGASAHSDHGRIVAKAFYEAVHGEAPLEIRDKRKLKIVANALGVDTNLPEQEMLKQIADKALQAFSQQEGELVLAHRAPRPLVEKWRKYKVSLRCIIFLSRNQPLSVYLVESEAYAPCIRANVKLCWSITTFFGLENEIVHPR